MYNFDYFANVPKRKIDHDEIYNPHSGHFMGSRSLQLMNGAYDDMKHIFPMYEFIEYVPGGGSLANERAILGLNCIKLHARPTDKNIVMLSSIEHTSISKHIFQSLNLRGYEIITYPTDKTGIINTETFEKLIDKYSDKIACVSCMMVNNEIGTIQPIQRIANIIKNNPTNSKIIFHCDVGGSVELFIDMINERNNIVYPDSITFSGYKFGGPHCGVMLTNIEMRPTYYGTPDVESIYKLTESLKLYVQETDLRSLENKKIKNVLKHILLTKFDQQNIKIIDLDTLNSVDNIWAFILPVLKASMIQQKLSEKQIAIGSGSACTTNEGSHTLKSIGYDSNISQRLIRLSFNALLFDDYEQAALLLAEEICEFVKEHQFLANDEKVIVGTPIFKITSSNMKKEPTFDGNLDEPIGDTLIDMIKVRYSEINLKGKNKSMFVTKLIKNMADKLKSHNVKIANNRGSIDIFLKEKQQCDSDKLQEIILVLRNIPGISMILPMKIIKCESAEDVCYNIAGLYDNERNKHDEKTYKVRVSMGSDFLNKKAKDWEYYIGRYIRDKYDDKVDLSNGNITIYLNYDGNRLGVYTQKIIGVGGLPIGTEGNVLFVICKQNMIRSLCALHLIARRGCTPVIVCNEEIYPNIKELTDSNELLNNVAIEINQNLSSAVNNEKYQFIVIESGYHASNFGFALNLNILKQIGNKIDKYTISITDMIPDDKIIEYCDIAFKNISNKQILYEQIKTTSPEILTKIDIDVPNIRIGLNSQIKGLLLISGGIDSPVASDILLKNGHAHNYVHYISSMDDETSKTKIINITKYVHNKHNVKQYKVIFVEFGRLQRKLAEDYREDYRVMLYKVFMVKIANDICKIHGNCYLTMGSALGQVASQTPENLVVTDMVSEVPVYNPLFTWNKETIVDHARKVGTYKYSICNGNDCCVTYLPSRPILKADISYINKIIDEIDYNEFITVDVVQFKL